MNEDELKQGIVDDRLLEALICLNKARNIVHESKSSKELEIYESYIDSLDSIQFHLNEHMAQVKEIIGTILGDRIEQKIIEFK